MKRSSRGQIAVELIFLSAIVVTLIGGFISLAATFLQTSLRAQNKLQAFTVAEAGIEYYRWHLAHAPTDYWDGNGSSTPGPYVHDYYNKDGDKIGQFSLAITPPRAGSSKVDIVSTGKVLADSSITKIIKVDMAPSTLLQFNLVQNADLQVGSTTTIFGPVMSNGGVHFDGFANSIVQSAISTYSDASENSSPTEWAVHTQEPPADPQPPTPLPLRPDVFGAGRQLSVPAADFGGLSLLLSNLSNIAQAGGVYASSSGAFGYDLAFSTTTTSTVYSLYKVTSLASPPNGCTNTSHVTGWGTWSIGSETFVASGSIPSNNTFFVADNLWVRGQIKGAQINIGAAVFPENSATWANVSINNSLRYTNYDGSDSILIVTQNNINVGLISDDTLRIDAALLTEHGRVGRFYYQPPNDNNNPNKCAPYATRTQIISYGSIVSNQAYGFGFADGTGYADRELLYDSSFYNNPPAILDPLFHGFTLTSWQEVQ